MKNIFFFFIFIIFSDFYLANIMKIQGFIPQEQILFRNLMRNYDPTVRPVFDNRESLDIYFRMNLMQILELSEKEQILVSNLWIEQVN